MSRFVAAAALLLRPLLVYISALERWMRTLGHVLDLVGVGDIDHHHCRVDAHRMYDGVQEVHVHISGGIVLLEFTLSRRRHDCTLRRSDCCTFRFAAVLFLLSSLSLLFPLVPLVV